MPVRLPRPRRFDVYVAVGGLLGGLLLWGVGLATRPHTEVYVLLPGRWPLLLPLVVMACCELLRRTAPRTGLLIGTAAIVLDLLTQGNLVTILMYTDLMYAAVLYGPPASAHRIPRITGLLTVAGAVVPFALWREPEALLIGVVTGLVAFGPAATGLIVRNHRDAAVAARLRAEQTALLAEMDRTQAVTPNGPGWRASCTTWSPTTCPRSPSTPPPPFPWRTPRPRRTRWWSSGRTAWRGSRRCGG